MKVFRTAIGFHDAYVAAPSQKAALEALGAESNLFAHGLAEAVTDDALMKAPLDKPGTVIKLSRGTIAEQIAGLPADTPRSGHAAPTPPSTKRAAKPHPKRKRNALDKAEEAVTDLEREQRDEVRELAKQEAELAKRKRAMQGKHSNEMDRLQHELQAARDDYDRARRAWKG